jgi:hypothetical protein
VHDGIVTVDSVLGPDELVPGRPFSDPINTWRDLEAMREMLARERTAARAWASEEESRSFNGPVHEFELEGRRHWLAVPDTRALLATPSLTAVGYFGQARDDTDHAILYELEEEVIAGFGVYVEAGLLSYYDMELADDRYGNLILFSSPDVPKEWYSDSAHSRAVSLAPQHFHSVRLHKGTIPGPLLGDGDVTIERTKYFAYEPDGVWHGVRWFGEPPSPPA